MGAGSGHLPGVPGPCSQRTGQGREVAPWLAPRAVGGLRHARILLGAEPRARRPHAAPTHVAGEGDEPPVVVAAASAASAAALAAWASATWRSVSACCGAGLGPLYICSQARRPRQGNKFNCAGELGGSPRTGTAALDTLPTPAGPPKTGLTACCLGIAAETAAQAWRSACRAGRAGAAACQGRGAPRIRCVPTTANLSSIPSPAYLDVQEALHLVAADGALAGLLAQLLGALVAHAPAGPAPTRVSIATRGHARMCSKDMCPVTQAAVGGHARAMVRRHKSKALTCGGRVARWYRAR